MNSGKLMMVQKGPCPLTLSAKTCPDNLYWPVKRSSGICASNCEVIVTGSTLKRIISQRQINDGISITFTNLLNTYENDFTLSLANPRICISEQMLVKSPILYSTLVL